MTLPLPLEYLFIFIILWLKIKQISKIYDLGVPIVYQPYSYNGMICDDRNHWRVSIHEIYSYNLYVNMWNYTCPILAIFIFLDTNFESIRRLLDRFFPLLDICHTLLLIMLLNSFIKSWLHTSLYLGSGWFHNPWKVCGFPYDNNIKL